MISDQIADFALNFRLNDAPEAVIAKVKDLILDHLGVAIGGTVLPSSRIALQFALQQGGKPESTAFGSRIKLPSANAAFSNGVSSHGFDMDDTEPTASIHIGTSVIPAAFSLAEMAAVDGETLLSAIICGYELTIRLGLAAQGATMSHYNRGFHPTATCGAFGAALAGSIILGLDKTKIKHALGIAGSAASGIMEFLSDGTWTKRFGAGRAAQNGVVAALLAKLGFTGPGTVFEGKFGFLHAYSDDATLDKLTVGLGEKFTSLNVGIKPHSCCRYIQSPIDAVISAVKSNDVQPDEIEEIRVEVVKKAIELLTEPRDAKYKPRNTVDAQFSIPYGVAVAAVKKRALIEEFTEKAIADPTVLKIAEKVTVIHNPELEKKFPAHWPANVALKLKDGGIIESRAETSKGDAENPLTQEELREKFLGLVDKILTQECSSKLILQVEKLEQAANIGDFFSSLNYRSDADIL